jgi:hypothetical protein
MLYVFGLSFGSCRGVTGMNGAILLQLTSLVSRNSPGNFLVVYGSGTSSFSNGTPSSSTTLSSSSVLSEHFSRVRA